MEKRKAAPCVLKDSQQVLPGAKFKNKPLISNKITGSSEVNFFKEYLVFERCQKTTFVFVFSVPDFSWVQNRFYKSGYL
jgi:hypothetical protein